MFRFTRIPFWVPTATWLSRVHFDFAPLASLCFPFGAASEAEWPKLRSRRGSRTDAATGTTSGGFLPGKMVQAKRQKAQELGEKAEANKLWMDEIKSASHQVNGFSGRIIVCHPCGAGVCPCTECLRMVDSLDVSLNDTNPQPIRIILSQELALLQVCRFGCHNGG